MQRLRRISLYCFGAVVFLPFPCVLQAVFGVFLFGESLPVLWWCGASVVLAGLVMIHHGARLPGTGTEQRFDDIPLEGTDRLANPTGGTDEWQKKME